MFNHNLMILMTKKESLTLEIDCIQSCVGYTDTTFD